MADTTLAEVMKVLRQIQSHSFDGALSFDGKPLKIGMMREDVDEFHRRKIDAFSVSSALPNVVRIKYTSQCKLEEVQGNKYFEDDVFEVVGAIRNHLQKEYKRMTGKSVTLSETKKHPIDIQYMSRVNCYLSTCVEYKLGEGVGKDEDLSLAPTVNDTIKKFLNHVKVEKRPLNDTRPKDKKED
jgi:AraC-like DNA-binding protein